MTQTETLDLSALTVDHFTPLVGQDFRVRYTEHEETLTLKSVSRYDGPPGERAPFSLLFDGHRADLLLNQHIHPLQNDTLGALDIFLVPVGRNPDGTISYQAVFS